MLSLSNFWFVILLIQWYMILLIRWLLFRRLTILLIQWFTILDSMIDDYFDSMIVDSMIYDSIDSMIDDLYCCIQLFFLQGKQAEEMPSWMTCLHRKMTSIETATNLKLFILKLIINEPKVCFYCRMRFRYSYHKIQILYYTGFKHWICIYCLSQCFPFSHCRVSSLLENSGFLRLLSSWFLAEWKGLLWTTSWWMQS